jgi:hypothetical protein
MAYRFYWKGGQEKVNEGSSGEENYKFYMFAVLEDTESIFYEATKQGLIKPAPTTPDDQDQADDILRSGAKPYVIFTPEIKVFMASQGFGVRRSYYSFFFKFENEVKDVITIRPFGPNHKNHLFRGRGRFMSNDEIKTRYGGDSQTFKYFMRQTYLSKAELRQHVTIGEAIHDGGPTQVRHVRV